MRSVAFVWYNGIVADTIKTNSETTNAHKVSIKTVLSLILFQTKNNNRKSRAVPLHGGSRIYASTMNSIDKQILRIISVEGKCFDEILIIIFDLFPLITGIHFHSLVLLQCT